MSDNIDYNQNIHDELRDIEALQDTGLLYILQLVEEKGREIDKGMDATKDREIFNFLQYRRADLKRAEKVLSHLDLAMMYRRDYYRERDLDKLGEIK